MILIRKQRKMFIALFKFFQIDFLSHSILVVEFLTALVKFHRIFRHYGSLALVVAFRARDWNGIFFIYVQRTFSSTSIYRVSLNHGLLNRWTSQYDWGMTTGWLERKWNILKISHHISIKLSVCTSMRVTALRAWSILTLALP